MSGSAPPDAMLDWGRTAPTTVAPLNLQTLFPAFRVNTPVKHGRKNPKNTRRARMFTGAGVSEQASLRMMSLKHYKVKDCQQQ
jgi:hypothetical protein